MIDDQYTSQTISSSLLKKGKTLLKNNQSYQKKWFSSIKTYNNGSRPFEWLTGGIKGTQKLVEGYLPWASFFPTFDILLCEGEGNVFLGGSMGGSLLDYWKAPKKCFYCS